MKKISFYILFGLIQLILVFSVGEVAIRFIHPQKTYSDLEKSVGNYFGPVFLVAGGVLPASGLDVAFDERQRSLS